MCSVSYTVLVVLFHFHGVLMFPWLPNLGKCYSQDEKLPYTMLNAENKDNPKVELTGLHGLTTAAGLSPS